MSKKKEEKPKFNMGDTVKYNKAALNELSHSKELRNVPMKILEICFAPGNAPNPRFWRPKPHIYYITDKVPWGIWEQFIEPASD